MLPQVRVEPLSGAHEHSRFVSGSPALDRYLLEQASQDVERRIATSFVAVEKETHEIAGFYTLSAMTVALDALSPELIRKLPRYPVVPAALLGRLTVAIRAQGKGLGAALLADAFLRVPRVDMGVYAMLVDAKEQAAQRFYEKHGFTLLAGETRRLVLPIATALRAMEGKVAK